MNHVYIYVYIQPFSPSIFQRPTSWARQNHQNPKPTTGISHELGTMLWNCHTSGAEFPSRCLLMASLLKEFGGWVGWSGSQSFLWQQTKNGKKTYVSTNVQVKWTLDHMCIYIYIQMLIILRLVQNTHLSHDDLLVEGSKLKRCYYITFCNKNYRHS